MKRLFFLAAIMAAAGSLHAQVVDTTVCNILKNPQSFDGKMVRIKGTAVAGFSQFVIQGKDCGQNLNAIWLSYPEGTKAKAGPSFELHLQPASNFAGKVAAAAQRTPVTLQMDKAFKEFDKHLADAHRTSNMCLGCNRYTVTATMVGRLDGVESAGYVRDKNEKIVELHGFGNLNAYRARLVLQSVSDVSTAEIRYDKSADASKGERQVPNAGKDMRADVTKAISAYGPGNSLGQQLQRALDAIGKPGDANGVVIGFDTGAYGNDALDTQSSSSSPDGVIYNCIFNKDRLKDNAMPIALAYAGTQIADIRSPEESTSGKDFFTLEFHAWQAAVMVSIGLRMKTLTMPGDYVAWNMGWEATQRDPNLQKAINDFLGNEMLVKR